MESGRNSQILLGFSSKLHESYSRHRNVLHGLWGVQEVDEFEIKSFFCVFWLLQRLVQPGSEKKNSGSTKKYILFYWKWSFENCNKKTHNSGKKKLKTPRRKRTYNNFWAWCYPSIGHVVLSCIDSWHLRRQCTAWSRNNNPCESQKKNSKPTKNFSIFL